MSKMNIPTHRKSAEPMFKKICAYEDCGLEFTGRGIQKYCDYHTDPKHRKRHRLRINKYKGQNIRFVTREVIDRIELECQAIGCHSVYSVKALPKVYEYPKFCEAHRNQFKREFFEKKYLESHQVAKAA